MNKIGSYVNPYSESTYQTMSGNHSWSGGWVTRASDLKVVYITTNGDVECDNGNDCLGSETNPFSSTAYNEMVAYETWVGGYVNDKGDIEYIPAQGEGGSGCGCGCDSGCGCGCGCGGGGLIAGQTTFRPDVFLTDTYFEISWENGTFSGGGQPSLTVTLVNGNNMGISNIQYHWGNAYRIKITFYCGGDYCDYDFDIPNQYHC